MATILRGALPFYPAASAAATGKRKLGSEQIERPFVAWAFARPTAAQRRDAPARRLGDLPLEVLAAERPATIRSGA
jgi:hypothetical protein